MDYATDIAEVHRAPHPLSLLIPFCGESNNINELWEKIWLQSECERGEWNPLATLNVTSIQILNAAVHHAPRPLFSHPPPCVRQKT
jgi:hypothetical protein